MAFRYLKATSPRGEVQLRYTQRAYSHATFHRGVGRTLLAVTFHMNAAAAYKANVDGAIGRMVVEAEEITREDYQAIKRSAKAAPTAEGPAPSPAPAEFPAPVPVRAKSKGQQIADLADSVKGRVPVVFIGGAPRLIGTLPRGASIPTAAAVSPQVDAMMAALSLTATNISTATCKGRFVVLAHG